MFVSALSNCLLFIDLGAIPGVLSWLAAVLSPVTVVRSMMVCVVHRVLCEMLWDTSLTFVSCRSFCFR